MNMIGLGAAGSPVFNALYAGEPTPEEIAQMALRPDQIMATEGAWPYANLSRYGIGAEDFATGGVYAMNDPYMRKVDQLYGALPPEIAGKVTVNSGYRTPDYNSSVGGAGGSQHLYGNAVDLGIEALSPEERAILSQTAGDIGFPGVGGYNGSHGHVHLDDGPARQWGEQHPGIDVAMIQGSGQAAPPPETPEMPPVAMLGAGDASPAPSGFLPVDDGRSGAGRVYDWMGDQGFLSSLLTGAGLLIGGNEALPLLGDFGGQYDQYAQQAKLQRDLERAMATLGGQLDQHSLAIVQSLAQAGQPDKALEYAMKALQGTDPEYAYEKQGDGTLVAINKRNPSDIRKIGGPKPADASGGLPAAIKEADFIARSEGLEPGSVEHRARVGELAKSWRAGSDSGYDIVTNEDGSRSYVPRKPGSPALPVEGLPEPPAPAPSLKTVTDGTGQPIVWDENTGQEVGRLGSARPADTPDPTKLQQEARGIAVQRALTAGIKPGSVEAARFIALETAKIVEQKLFPQDKLDPNSVEALDYEKALIARYNNEAGLFIGQAEAYQNIESNMTLALTDEKDPRVTPSMRAAAKQAVVIDIAKILDPDSVVRTEEGDQIRRTGGLYDGILGQLQGLLGGGDIPANVLEGYLAMARQRIAGQYGKAAGAHRRHSARAKAAGLDPETFMPPMPQYDWLKDYQDRKLQLSPSGGATAEDSLGQIERMLQGDGK